MVRRLVSDEQEGMWKEAVILYMRQTTQHAVSGVTAETRTIRLPIKSLDRYRYADRLV
jgi:hypothetical protein